MPSGSQSFHPQKSFSYPARAPRRSIHEPIKKTVRPGESKALSPSSDPDIRHAAGRSQMTDGSNRATGGR